MSRRQWPLVLLVLVVVLQCAVPLKMILRRETALKQGVVYRFKTAPVDPYDAFRGRYVALNYEQSRVPWALAPDSIRREKLFAVLGTDEDGFAEIRDLVRTRPADEDWIPVRCGWRSADTIRLRLPFDRYFMNEKDAPEAERRVRDLNRAGDARTTYAEIRVHRGFPVIDRLIVDSKPIEEYLGESES